MFLVGQRRRLARRAADDDRVGRVFDLTLNHDSEFLVVDFVVREGRDNRDGRSGENGRFLV